MTAMSDFLEAALLNHTFRNTAYTTPGLQIWVALYTATPSDTGGGTEVTGGSYARIQCTGWNAPGVAGLIDNTAAITFATATADWGTVTSVAILDAVTAGNFLVWGALTASKIVNSGDQFQFAAGALDITFA